MFVKIATLGDVSIRGSNLSFGCWRISFGPRRTFRWPIASPSPLDVCWLSRLSPKPQRELMHERPPSAIVTFSSIPKRSCSRRLIQTGRCLGLLVNIQTCNGRSWRKGRRADRRGGTLMRKLDYELAWSPSNRGECCCIDGG